MCMFKKKLTNYIWIKTRNFFKYVHVICLFRLVIFRYRKYSIDRPEGIHFFSTHNFWTTCHRTIIKAYSYRKVFILSEYVFIFVLLCMIRKLCVDKKWIPSGLSIEILRYWKWYLRISKRLANKVFQKNKIFEF